MGRGAASCEFRALASERVDLVKRSAILFWSRRGAQELKSCGVEEEP
jgi:hypothetical protein